MASKRKDDTCYCVMDTDKLNKVRSQRRFAQINVIFVMILMCGVTISSLVRNGLLSDSLESCKAHLTANKLSIAGEDSAVNNISIRTTINDVGNYVELVERNKWLWIGLSVAGFVVAIAAATTPIWAPVFVAGAFGKILVSLLTVASGALGIAGTVGSVTTKRSNEHHFHSGEYLGSDRAGGKMYFYSVIDNLGVSVHQDLTSFNNFEYIAFTYNGTNSRADGGMYASSSIGNHTLVANGAFSLEEMISEVARQNKEGCIGECFQEKYGMSNVGTFQKRTSYYDVNWSSYNYDIWLQTNAEVELDSPDIDFDDVENLLNNQYADNGDPDTWKYCMCVDGDTNGGYNGMGEYDGVAGEVYFNTYGGIDGYCNTAHCGAQCSTDGCQ